LNVKKITHTYTHNTHTHTQHTHTHTYIHTHTHTTAMAGKGLKSIVSKHEILIGNKSFMKENEIILFKKNSEGVKKLQEEGKTVIYAAVDGNIVIFIYLFHCVKVIYLLFFHCLFFFNNVFFFLFRKIIGDYRNCR